MLSIIIINETLNAAKINAINPNFTAEKILI